MNKNNNNRKYAIGFSVAGSILTILFFIFINYTAGGSFPWFIFPSYAVLWWPIALIFGRNSGKLLSLIGSLLTIALLVIVNYLTSWGYPWFLYPAFAILWWPIAMYWGRNHQKAFSVIGSLTVILSALVLNLIFTPDEFWFYYPAIAVIWWPLGRIFHERGLKRSYSVIGAVILLCFLISENIFRSPGIPWVLFGVYPLIMWPVTVFLGDRRGKTGIALLFSLLGIGYYSVLNLFVFRGFPWAIFPAYALLWWPLSVGAPEKVRELFISISGTILSSALFIVINLVASPRTVWAVYPIFAFIWWPLSVYYFVYRRRIVES